MASARPIDDLAPLCRQAEALAARRKERPTTAHLLLAVASQPTVGSSLLEAHKLTAPRLEQALPGGPEEDPDAVRRAVQSARDIATRTRSKAPSSQHVLLALLGDRKFAAYMLIERCGADPARLRMATMQIAIGATAPRRVPEATANAPTPQKPTPHRAPPKPQHAVAISMVPTPRPRSTPPPPPESQSMPIAPPAPRVPAEMNAVAISRSVEERLTLDPKLFPVLSAFGKNLSLMMMRGELPQVIGRDEEIERCLDVLARRQANNPVLLGPAGVGKSSVVRGVALRVAEARVGTSDERILIDLSMAELCGGISVRGALAERMGSIRQEVARASGRVVLVLEDLHLLFSGEIDAEIGSDMRLALSRGEMPCLGTSTTEDYRRVVDQDPTIARRFSPVLVEEPSHDETFEVLKTASDPLSRHHKVTFDDEVLGAAITWSTRYLPGRALPDKALSILDLAGARSSRRGQRDVMREVVASVIAEMTEVPVSRMMETDTERMLSMESLLAESVVGHAPMLSRISAILRRNAAGIRGRRPIGTFLLLGPTGVGKTETAKAIAKALFDSPDAMTRLDLSEYAESHSIARLIGAPPGYVGHESGGQLTEAVRRRPYQVVLLDEIEKAHRDVLEAFLQVFDEGRLTDGRGRTVDFTSTVLVLTSNLGASAAIAPSNRSIGFRNGMNSEARGDEAGVIAAARDALPPELYNRIDEVLVFRPLDRADVREIARRLLDDLGRTLQEARGVELTFSDGVCDALLTLGGYDPTLGARPMKRAIAKHIEAPLAELILRGDLGEGDIARLRVSEAGEIVIDTPLSDDAREKTRVVA